MPGLEAQTDFWNGEAATKTFSHPLPLAELRAELAPGAAILDYGCGYGRLTAQVAAAGFAGVVGVDIAASLLDRGRREHPGLDLRLIRGLPLPFASGVFDACLLVAVLNCVPTEAGAEALLGEVRRVLRPGGLLFVSDYPLQDDPRNRERYARHAAEFGLHGVFRAGGGVFRHYSPERLDGLLAGTAPLWRRELDIATMNGHPARIVQLAVRTAQG